MSACPSRSYSGISRPIFNAIIAEVAKRSHENLNPETVADQGQTEGDGYGFQWSFSETSATLVAQCTDSPWYAPCSAIGNAMDEMVADARTDGANQ